MNYRGYNDDDQDNNNNNNIGVFNGNFFFIRFTYITRNHSIRFDFESFSLVRFGATNGFTKEIDS